MKTTVTLFLCLLCFSVKAQDIILKIDQSVISVKVSEITTDEVKFKYFNRSDGPVYTLKKTEISSITYQDGTRETFTKLVAAEPTTQTNKPIAQLPPSATVQSTSSNEKRNGFTGGLFYVTPSATFGEVHGMAGSAGYYLLGKNRRGGCLLDADFLFFFNDATTRFTMFTVNGIYRLSESGKFYLGGGIGLGNVSTEVEAYDYISKRTTTKRVGEYGFGGKAYVGYGAFRVSALMPFLENSQDGSLITVGFVKSVF